MQFYHWDRRFAEENALRVGGRILPAFISRVLAARGVKDSEAAAHFLQCDEPLADPMLLRDMDKAVLLVQDAIDKGKKILVFGDYDCDGITATVMLYDYLENAGADVCYYIPERVSEGYGLGMDSIDMVKSAGIELMITVDNGISSQKEVAYAKEQGIAVIVTDHHAVPEELPVADAVVNPHRTDSEYPYRELCGAGVAFKLICALEVTIQGGEDVQELLLEQYGDLLAIGTLADIVPLTGENRLLARHGLSALASTLRPGLLALAEVAKIDLSACTSETVSFAIAPRINVTGRIGSVDTAVQLLLSNDEEEAARLADEMNALNIKRREMETQISQEITQELNQKPSLLYRRLLVVTGDDWHLGVIGISASRLVEKYRKPSFVISCKDGIARGSCRSVEGFSIIEAITACKELLEKFGGHPMAAGFTLKEENIPQFIDSLENFAAEYYPVMPVHTLKIDAPVLPEELTLPNVQSLMELQPFGSANPQPVFLLSQVMLSAITPIGNGQHLRLNVTAGNVNIPLVMFGTSAEVFPFMVGETIDVACCLSINTYNDQQRVSIRVVNLHPTDYRDEERVVDEAGFWALMRGEPAGEGTPGFSREELAPLFRLLREKSPFCGGIDVFFHECSRRLPQVRYFTVLAAMQVMLELGLITRNEEDIISVVQTAKKVNLEESPTFRRMQADR